MESNKLLELLKKIIAEQDGDTMSSTTPAMGNTALGNTSIGSQTVGSQTVNDAVKSLETPSPLMNNAKSGIVDSLGGIGGITNSANNLLDTVNNLTSDNTPAMELNSELEELAPFLNEDKKGLLKLVMGGKLSVKKLNDGGKPLSSSRKGNMLTDLALQNNIEKEEEVPQGLQGVRNALKQLGTKINQKAISAQNAIQGKDASKESSTKDSVLGKEIPDSGKAINRGLLGEQALNTGLGIVNTLRANEAAKQLNRLQRPKPQTNQIATPATFEAGMLENAQEGIDAQAQEARRQLQANTGDLRSLMAGITNINANTQNAKRGLSEQAMSQYNQDKQRYIQEQKQNALSEQNLTNQFNEQQFQDERNILGGSVELANKAFASNLQNVLGIAKNRRDLGIARDNEIRQAQLLIKGGLQDYINSQKQKEGVGDKYFAASAEERMAMEERWRKEYENIAKKYEPILNVGNPFTKGIFRRGGKLKKKERKSDRTEELREDILEMDKANRNKELQSLRQLFAASRLPYSVFLDVKPRR